MRRIMLVMALLLLIGTAASPAAAREPDETAFMRVWERTDLPVLTGEVQRTWYWGPEPFDILIEPYDQGLAGERLVQYYDKGRMEITNPNDDPESEWYVTSGLIVREMIKGRIQTGDENDEPWRAQSMPIAGDEANNPDAPTYASFKRVASVDLPSPGEMPLPFPYGPGAEEDAAELPRIGRFADAAIDKDGIVTSNAGLAGLYAGTRIVYYSLESNHNIPEVFWTFLNAEGLVKEGPRMTTDVLVNWIYLTGYPITEPYWVETMVGGVERDVLVQAFERRVLTYTPSNPPGWRVEMGNAGRHYYNWRYESEAIPPAQLPANVNGTVEPSSGPVGTVFVANLYGFDPGETVSVWLTLPDQSVAEAPEPGYANDQGQLVLFDSTDIEIFTLFDEDVGIWALTGQGDSSKKMAIVYFEVTE